jgi:hypothetical protein
MREEHGEQGAERYIWTQEGEATGSWTNSILKDSINYIPCQILLESSNQYQ